MMSLKSYRYLHWNFCHHSIILIPSVILFSTILIATFDNFQHRNCLKSLFCDFQDVYLQNGDDFRVLDILFPVEFEPETEIKKQHKKGFTSISKSHTTISSGVRPQRYS